MKEINYNAKSGGCTNLRSDISVLCAIMEEERLVVRNKKLSSESFQNKKITNSEYQKLNSVSKATASRELSALVKKGIIERRGKTGRGMVYILKGSNGS